MDYLCDRCKKNPSKVEVLNPFDYEPAYSHGMVCLDCASESKESIQYVIWFDYYEDADNFMSNYEEKSDD